MDVQVAAMCKSAWYHLYQISKIRQYLNKEQAKTVIHSYVTSRLDNSNSILIGLPKYQISKLQIIQNASARLIEGIKKHEHITPTLKALHWLPVEKRIIYKILVITYKVLHGEGPMYLRDLLISYIPSRSLRSSSDNQLCVPKVRYAETAKRAFAVRAPTEWNSLPKIIRRKQSLDS